MQACARTLGVVGFGLLSSCTLEPLYRVPPLPVPDQWPLPENGAPLPAAEANPTDAPSWEIGWRELFVDPQLQQLIAQALTNNRDLRVSILNVELARAQYHIQRADLLPQV